MPLLVDYVGCLEFYSLWFSIIVAFQCYIILRILTLHTVTIMVTLLRKAGGVILLAINLDGVARANLPLLFVV